MGVQPTQATHDSMAGKSISVEERELLPREYPQHFN
jgi:hypothetical protein